MNDKRSQADRLANEARRLYGEADREERQHQYNREEEFRLNAAIDVYASDDYSGLEVGKYAFYYGYERTVPVDPEDDDDSEWAFTASVDGSEVLRIATSALYPWMNEEPLFYLVAGIGHFLKQRG